MTTTSNVAEIDKHFLGEAVTYDRMTFHSVFDEPFKLYGLYHPKEERTFKRIPSELAMKLNPYVKELYTNTSGARIRFRTDSTKILLRSILPKISFMDHMPKTGTSFFDLYVDGEYRTSFLHGNLGAIKPCSTQKSENTYDACITIGKKMMHDILIHFPLYNDVAHVFIALDDDASIEQAKEYTIKKPFVIYGSSITQGGCASHPGNAFPNMLSRRFDADILNLGFSSGGLAEPEIAEYIGSLDMSIFLYDYDHNAPTTDYLNKTHEPMFKTIREMQPDLPIIMASAADSLFGKMDSRRKIIKATYDNAIAAGDKNVYFIDGRTIYAPVGCSLCTVDNLHPNDLGFYMMANAYGQVIEEILLKQKNIL